MSIDFRTPPREVCIMRLSAIGDVCHTLPVIRSLQAAWPETRWTWIIGKVEAELLGDIPEIEFIIFDKREGWRGIQQLRKRLRGRQFELLLHMQMSLRSSLVSTLVSARTRLGFDRERSRELQWLFTTDYIQPSESIHVMDVLFGFADAVGVHDRRLEWDIPLSDDDREYAAASVDDRHKTLVISASSSLEVRDWRPEYYAVVADHAIRQHDMRVILSGAPGNREREMGAAIRSHMSETPVDLIGGTTLKQLLALLDRADLLLCPDSGPVHMATTVRTPVIGLYACSSSARTGPYFSRGWTVDRFDEAVRRFLGQPVSELPWRTKIERPGVMDLIRPEDVVVKLDEFVRESKDN